LPTSVEVLFLKTCTPKTVPHSAGVPDVVGGLLATYDPPAVGTYTLEDWIWNREVPPVENPISSVPYRYIPVLVSELKLNDGVPADPEAPRNWYGRIMFLPVLNDMHNVPR